MTTSSLPCRVIRCGPAVRAKRNISLNRGALQAFLQRSISYREPKNIEPLQIALRMKRADAHISTPLALSNFFCLRSNTTAGITKNNCHNPGCRITNANGTPPPRRLTGDAVATTMSTTPTTISSTIQIATPFPMLFASGDNEASSENSGFSSMLHSYGRAQRRQSRLFQLIAVEKVIGVERNQTLSVRVRDVNTCLLH